MALTLQPNTGLTDGGEDVIVSASAAELDMSAVTPNFGDGSLDAMWTNISAGGGAVTEAAAVQSLYLNAGTAAAGVAGVRTTATETTYDVEAQVSVVSVVAPAGVTVSVFELALRVDANNDFRVIIERTGATQQVRVRVRTAGVTGYDFVVATAAIAGGVVRLQRNGALVNVFVSNSLVLSNVAWVSTAASAELRAANHATVASSVRVYVTRYTRRPVVLFDGSPATTVRTSGIRQAVVGAVPRLRPGVVDVTVVGCLGASSTLVNGYTYTLDAGRVRLSPELTLLNDV